MEPATRAVRWGFNDMSHFSRAFRERFAMSPRAWRDLRRAGDRLHG
ncbi:helix-turn-helix domain-containing protein [Burkholderia anthina]|nr:helix-turn-helix domain-containing protein [Burkholderia anthina]